MSNQGILTQVAAASKREVLPNSYLLPLELVAGAPGPPAALDAERRGPGSQECAACQRASCPGLQAHHRRALRQVGAPLDGAAPQSLGRHYGPRNVRVTPAGAQHR